MTVTLISREFRNGDYIALEAKPADVWVGLYVRLEELPCMTTVERVVDLWICFVPMFPIHFRFHLSDLSRYKWQKERRQ